jgi:hypothetical protein
VIQREWPGNISIYGTAVDPRPLLETTSTMTTLSGLITHNAEARWSYSCLLPQVLYVLRRRRNSGSYCFAAGDLQHQLTASGHDLESSIVSYFVQVQSTEYIFDIK